MTLASSRHEKSASDFKLGAKADDWFGISGSFFLPSTSFRNKVILYLFHIIIVIISIQGWIQRTCFYLNHFLSIFATPISALRNTKDGLQSGITVKSNMAQSQMTYIASKILRKCQRKFDCLRNALWTNRQLQSVQGYLYNIFSIVLNNYFNTFILALLFTYFIVDILTS